LIGPGGRPSARRWNAGSVAATGPMAIVEDSGAVGSSGFRSALCRVAGGPRDCYPGASSTGIISIIERIGIG
jgi:hypothetical protein